MSKRIPDAASLSVTEKPPQAQPLSEGTPDVTVVTVVYNAVRAGREQPFRACLDSVQTQRGCRIEHVIVDGGSDDGTMEIVSGYANESVPIRCVSKPDRGLYEAMNRGIALSRGRVVTFLNSDDRFCRPDGMSLSLKAIESQGAAYSYAPALVVNGQGHLVDHVFSHADEMYTLCCGMAICHQTLVVRREVLLSADGFDLAFRSAADYDLLLRLVYAGRKGVRLAEPFVEFKCGGFSAQNDSLSEDETDALFQNRFREAFDSHLSRAAIRCMRMSLSYPSGLFEKIRLIGERSFGRSLSEVSFDRKLWEAAVKWRLDSSFPSAVWNSYALPLLPDGRAKGLLQCGWFSVCHPVHALGAVKAWLSHRKDGYLPLDKWFSIRCALMVERVVGSCAIVSPDACSAAREAENRSIWGAVCRQTVRMSVKLPGERACARIFALLYPFDYREEEETVDIVVGGQRVGSVSMAFAESGRWGVFRIPRTIRKTGSVAVELTCRSGRPFVFGGLILCPEP